MNDYREVRINVSPCSETVTDILAQFLSEAGYESFVADENGLTSYIKNELYDPAPVAEIIENFPIEDIKMEVSDIFVEGRDWNSEWEQHYFKPIIVNGQCVIHSSFHKDIPQAEYDIVIDPKMAFGTGHHQTTSLIIERLLSMNLDKKSIIDMGTGTGILAILAAMRGASPITAIEIDPMAHVNAVENVKLNGHPEIDVVLGDASALSNVQSADILLANINRNIIVSDMESYSKALKAEGTMILSGFYEEDIPVVAKVAEQYGLKQTDYTTHDRWASLSLKKS
ncbi:MAG: 50S ribosomal protein L11 methyltransferase [Muribaculaceae bacterium]|nr:50S ribosomal protein L11 methyltransferase [Muribaculaceae bacterium]